MEDTLTTTTIEDLPEDVVVFHILPFLSTLDAIVTCTLVRSWLNLWHQVPVLRFDIIPFYKMFSPPYAPVRALFAYLVGQTFFLLPTHTPLQHFQLAFHHADYGSRETEIRSWIRRAVERGVLKLEIHFYRDIFLEGGLPMWRGFHWRESPVDFAKTFEFRFFDIINSSVTEFQLCNCGISFPSNVSTAAGFESLKKLVLRHVRLYETHEIECLLSVCVNLEILNLEIIHNLYVDEFRIHLKRLKKLTLKDHHRFYLNHDDYVIDIDTPELLSLTVDNFGVGCSSMRINAPSLVEADFDLASGYSENSEVWHSLIMSLQNVQRLRLQKLSRFPWNSLARFSYLKFLELLTGFSEDDLLGILGILKASPMLENVIIHSYDYYNSWFDIDDLTLSEKLDDKFVDLKIPRLRELTIKDYRKTRNELYLVDRIKKNNVMLKRIVAVPVIYYFGGTPIVLWELTLTRNVQEDLEHT